MFWSLIQNEFWIELQICGAVFRKFVIHSGKFQVNSDWLIKTGFWCWILEWLPNIQLIFLSTDSLQFLILFLPIFYQFLQHYSAKKIFFFSLFKGQVQQFNFGLFDFFFSTNLSVVIRGAYLSLVQTLFWAS